MFKVLSLLPGRSVGRINESQKNRSETVCQMDMLESRRLMTAEHTVAINFNDEALWEANFSQAVEQAKSLGVTAVRIWMGINSYDERYNAFDPIPDPINILPRPMESGEPRSANGMLVMRRAFELKEAGFSVLIIMNNNLGVAPESPDQLKNFMRHVVGSHRYADGTGPTLADAVDYWQLGNEVDSANYWRPSGTLGKTAGIDQYVRDVLIPAADVLHDPANGINEKVVSAGPSFSPGDVRTILRSLESRGRLDAVDYAGFHPYGSYDPSKAGSVNQPLQRATEAKAIADTFGKPLIASEWNVRGFGTAGLNDQRWANALGDVYRQAILPNFAVGYYFALVNNWAARSGTISARPGALLKHVSSTGVTTTSPSDVLIAYYQSPLISSDPFYSTYNAWQYGRVSGAVLDTSASGQLIPATSVYIDINKNGQLDTSEPSNTIDANGLYDIQYSTRKIKAGDEYLIRVVTPDGWLPERATVGVTLANLTTLSNINLSLRPQTAPQLASISGVLWSDTNGNGSVDTGESPTGVRTVFIDTNANSRLDVGERQTQSAADGSYQFTGLTAGIYTISRVFPNGFRMSNATAGNYRRVTVSDGQQLTGFDIGATDVPANNLTPTGTGIIRGTVMPLRSVWQTQVLASRWTVYIDLNNNARRDATERFTTTATSGSWELANLGTGNHRVRLENQPGFAVTNALDPVFNVMLFNGQLRQGRNFLVSVV
jgi:hypothetical protein